MGDEIVVVLADGAGGTGGGAEAAEHLIEATRERIREGRSDWSDLGTLLLEADRFLAARGVGETTAVVAVVGRSGVRGASVGDSEAWLVRADGWEDLTQGQVRKPLLGSGRAIPVSFGLAVLDGTLVVASDGLFKYARADVVCEAARRSATDAVAPALVERVRLPSGALPDDIAIVVCRPTGSARSR